MTASDPSANVAAPGPASRAAVLGQFARSVPWAVYLITAVAEALRFAELDDVFGNPFYDAAVRSMSLSWHNFFFGAFDPRRHPVGRQAAR